MIGFADLDDFDLTQQAKTEQMQAEQKCPRCYGAGRVSFRKKDAAQFNHTRTYHCTMCQGRGMVTSRRIKRVTAGLKARKTRATGIAVKRKSWREAHPEVEKWIRANRNAVAFAEAMAIALNVFGTLTDRQTHAVQRCMDGSR